MIRNLSVDYLKIICAFLVVLIHCEYPFKEVMLPITDVAVPLFFCMSGYFIYGSERKTSRIVRIFKIFGWAFVLYLVKTEVFQYLTLHHFYIPTLKNLIDLILFNDVAFAIHLWYLPAYLYVLIVAFFIDKYHLWKWAFYSIIPLILIGSIIKIQVADYDSTQIQYFRNWLFDGLAYFSIGALVKQYQKSNILKINQIAGGGGCYLADYKVFAFRKRMVQRSDI